jgi:diaminohydroxyphosphoribosylaminopyrimidine deaminase/5-amino-6-(5-phosphoribosylamino)uracil reductase
MLGNTKNNPAVGCVITKNNNLIAAGVTSYNGRPHAEVNAINFSKFSVTNSDIYTTLEPCSNHGKTPPCVNKIISKKIK